MDHDISACIVLKSKEVCTIADSISRDSPSCFFGVPSSFWESCCPIWKWNVKLRSHILDSLTNWEIIELVETTDAQIGRIRCFSTHCPQRYNRVTFKMTLRKAPFEKSVILACASLDACVPGDMCFFTPSQLANDWTQVLFPFRAHLLKRSAYLGRHFAA